jgi:DNA-binding IclR family transcriptional regulator
VFGRRTDDQRSVASRLLAILGSFSPGDPELNLRQIGVRAGLAPSTTHRLVGDLCAWGALERDEHGLYRIGTRLRELARIP